MAYTPTKKNVNSLFEDIFGPSIFRKPEGVPVEQYTKDVEEAYRRGLTTGFNMAKSTIEVLALRDNNKPMADKVAKLKLERKK